jgi:hypothetical protein
MDEPPLLPGTNRPPDIYFSDRLPDRLRGIAECKVKDRDYHGWVQNPALLSPVPMKAALEGSMTGEGTISMVAGRETALGGS